MPKDKFTEKLNSLGCLGLWMYGLQMDSRNCLRMMKIFSVCIMVLVTEFCKCKSHWNNTENKSIKEYERHVNEIARNYWRNETCHEWNECWKRHMGNTGYFKVIYSDFFPAADYPIHIENTVVVEIPACKLSAEHNSASEPSHLQFLLCSMRFHP